MPKEYVFQRNKHGDPATQSPVALIGWGRDLEYVEIGTFTYDDNIAVCEFDEENGCWIPMEALQEQGLVACLSKRQDVNRLIRILKRARDQAFGRDE